MNRAPTKPNLSGPASIPADPARLRGASRASRAVVVERARSGMLAQRLGSGLREGRIAARLTQRAVAQRVGTSQGTISALERGHGASSPLELWTTVAAAV